MQIRSTGERGNHHLVRGDAGADLPPADRRRRSGERAEQRDLRRAVLRQDSKQARVGKAFDRPLVDVLRMFVVAHQKVRLDAAETFVTGDDVRRDFFVRRAEMRAAVDVVDGGGEIEAHGI